MVQSSEQEEPMDEDNPLNEPEPEDPAAIRQDGDPGAPDEPEVNQGVLDEPDDPA